MAFLYSELIFTVYLEVLVPLAVNRAFWYRYEGEICDLLGLFVKVSFRRFEVIGLVIGCHQREQAPLDIAPNAIKEVQAVKFGWPKLSIAYMDFIRWVADYNMVPIGLVLKMSQCQLLSELDFLSPAAKSVDSPIKSKSYLKVMECFKVGSEILSSEEITYRTKIRKSTIDKMLAEGLLEVVAQTGSNKLRIESGIELTGAQIQALRILCDHNVSLLDGVTGSGKTEVYLKFIEELLNRDPSAQGLIMLPEISLTSHLVARFRSYLGEENIIEWHSGLGDARRVINLQKIVYGSARIIVGARSALFLPYKNLQVVVVDEEHDSSYKQTTGAKYNARDMALVLAKIAQVKLIMVSATPSLESMNNVALGKVKRVVLCERFAAAELPVMKLVDMKGQKCILSQDLTKAIENRIRLGQQVLLFVNRRGYAPVTLCHKCGFKAKCVNCSVWLVYHEKHRCLMCHHCGYHTPMVWDCGNCGAEGSIVDLGLGIEKLESEVKKCFSGARIAVLSSDSNDGASVVESILENRVDIILGTQIIAKGYHFPNLNLVGVISADQGLSCGDLRASERTYQLLNQVAGRCGRDAAGGTGEVILQSYNSNSAFMKALLNYDREAFYECELKDRELAAMPPYTRLASVVVANKNENKALEHANLLARRMPAAPPREKLTILGPAAAPIHLLRGVYRFRFLLISHPKFRVQNYLRKWLDDFPHARSLDIDIDPISLF